MGPRRTDRSGGGARRVLWKMARVRVGIETKECCALGVVMEIGSRMNTRRLKKCLEEMFWRLEGCERYEMGRGNAY